MRTGTDWVGAYLDWLGLKADAPTLAFLGQICTAHLSRIPFENISKLLQFRDYASNGYLIPPVEQFVASLRDHHFGGTCYQINGHLQALLCALGFDAACVQLGKSHLAIVVAFRESGERVYVDCGSAAPLFTPVRFELDPENRSIFGQEEIRIAPVPHQAGWFKYDRFRNGELLPNDWSFQADQTRSFTSFQPVIAESCQPGSTFMSILRCHVWQPHRHRSLSLVNNKLSIRCRDGSETQQTFSTVSGIEAVLAAEFGFPKLPVRAAVGVLSSLGVDIFQSHSQ